MKRIISLLTIACAFAISMFAANETYSLNIGQFDKLNVSDNVEVVYHCNPDSTGYVVYSAPKNLADAFIFSNTKGTLKIQVSTEEVYRENLPVLHVYSDYLTSVISSSDLPVTIYSLSSVPTFYAKLIGNGKIVANEVKANEVEANFVTGNGEIIIGGSCKLAKYKMVGAGTIQADEMKADAVQCKVMGAGNIGCWPVDKLDVRGIGSTKIYYKGSPEVKKVGGGKLFPLSEEKEEE